MSFPARKDPITIPTQKPAPTAPICVGEKLSIPPRTLRSVPCNVLPICMSPKPRRSPSKVVTVAHCTVAKLSLRVPQFTSTLILIHGANEVFALHARHLRGVAEVRANDYIEP